MYENEQTLVLNALVGILLLNQTDEQRTELCRKKARALITQIHFWWPLHRQEGKMEQLKVQLAVVNLIKLLNCVLFEWKFLISELLYQKFQLKSTELTES